MPRGGYRPGSGRRRKPQAGPDDTPPAPSDPSILESKTPLEYMLAIMNDPRQEQSRRDRMAQAAAPYVHAKAGEAGKKESKVEAAKKSVAGRFAPAAPPPARVN